VSGTQFNDPAYLEQVYAALFALLTSATFANGLTFETASRVVVEPAEVPPANQPALLLYPGPLDADQREQKLFGVTKWTFTALAMIYIQANSQVSDPTPLPATLANYFIWGIQNVLTSQLGKRITLGGLVDHCWIQGAVVPQVVNEQMTISIPIYILAGPSGVGA
jgi:hypothetical protein